MASIKTSQKKSADLSTTVREILNLSEETGKKAADGIRKEAAKVKEATTKAAEAAKARKAEEKTQETKDVAPKKAPAKKEAPKKAPAKKEAPKKTTASKAAGAAKKTATAVKKTVAAAKAKAEEKTAEPKVFIQFAGNSFSLDEILEDARKDYTKGRKKTFKDVQIYVKPEDGKAYYVADGDPGAVDLKYNG